MFKSESRRDEKHSLNAGFTHDEFVVTMVTVFRITKDWVRDSVEVASNLVPSSGGRINLDQ